MALKEELFKICDEYQRVNGCDAGRLSYYIFNGDGSRLDRLRSGELKTVTLLVFERAIVWLSNNWPDGAVWPKGVRRRYSSVAVDPNVSTQPVGRPEKKKRGKYGARK